MKKKRFQGTEPPKIKNKLRKNTVTAIIFIQIQNNVSLYQVCIAN